MNLVEACDEVNLKGQTLDDELKVYCVFHSDLVLDDNQDHPMFMLDGIWFTSSPSSASAVIETLRRLGERDVTSNRWIRSDDEHPMDSVRSSDLVTDPIDYLSLVPCSPRRRLATWLNSFVIKTRASDSSTSSRQNRPFLLARPLARHPQSFHRRPRHEPAR